MDVDKEELEASTPNAAVGDTADWTQLDTFSEGGGKLIFFHGVNDPWFSAQDTVRYYQKMVADNGGASAVSNWSRLFLVPGMGHCRGGASTLDDFDLIDPIVHWVEKGEAPQSVNCDWCIFPASHPSAVPLSTTRALQGNRRQ